MKKFRQNKSDMAIILKSVQEFWKIKRGKLLKKVKIFLTIIIIICFYFSFVLFCFVFFFGGGGGGRGKDVKFWLTFKIVSKVQWSSVQKDKF